MEEKKKIKISLGTIICILIIIILIIALGIVYYLGSIKDSKTTLQNVSIVNKTTEEDKNNELLKIAKKIKDEKYSYISIEEIIKKDEEYFAKINIHETLTITKKEFDKMVYDKKIVLDGLSYKYINEESNYDEHYGYIEGNNRKYEVVKSNNNYEFVDFESPGRTFTYYIEEFKYLPIAKETEVYDAFDEKEYTLENHFNKIKQRIENQSLITLGCSTEGEDTMYIYISNK